MKLNDFGPLRRIGKGMFTTAYLGKGKRVYLEVKDSGGDYAKEILCMLGRYGYRSTYIPPTHEMGMTHNATIYSMVHYRNPLRKGHSARAWQQYRALKDCLERAQMKISSNPYNGYRISQLTVEYARDHPDIPPGLVGALELLADNAANYGEDWTFEFAPRNLATTKKGHLILLDVLFSIKNVIAKRDKKRGEYR